MDARAETVLDRPNRALDFAHMTVRRNDVHLDGFDAFADTFELAVGVDVLDAESAVAIGLDHGQDTVKDGLVAAIGGRDDGTETQISRDGVQETETLHKKEIDAESDVPVELKNGCGDRNCSVRWGTRSGSGTCHFSF